MKPLARFLMMGVAGLSVATLIATAALTNGEPALSSPPFVAGSTNLGLAHFGPAPIVYLGGRTSPSQPLKPGVYQTRPYAIILVVPESGIDDRCVVGGIDSGSKMPVAKPDLQAIPKAFSR